MHNRLGLGDLSRAFHAPRALAAPANGYMLCCHIVCRQGIRERNGNGGHRSNHSSEGSVCFSRQGKFNVNCSKRSASLATSVEESAGNEHPTQSAWRQTMAGSKPTVK